MYGKLALIILGLTAIGSFLFKPELDYKTLVHTNSIDQKLSTYSDQQITVNARITDPRFSDLAFEPVKNSPYSQLATVWRPFRYIGKYFAKSDKPSEYGTWLWTPTLNITPQYAKNILTEAKKDEVKSVYLSIDSYLDIFVMPEGEEKESRKREFEKVVDNFIAEAGDRGINVDAEAGWRNWAEPGNEYKAWAILNFVKDFNTRHTHKFRGFQYDIEPYLLENFKNDPELVLKNYIGLIDKSETFLEESGINLTLVIPSFYDKRDGSVPLITYMGSKDSVFKHLLNILDRQDGNSIILMSYRNFADGKDGSIDISKNELNTARRGFYNTKIIVAQETGNFLPRYITFYGKSRDYFSGQTALVTDAFKSNLNFGGLAVHYANTMSLLK